MTLCYKKDYPRPQLVRDNWENLNGCWDFGFDDANVGEQEEWFKKFPGGKTIQVPFTYETKLSGIGDEARHDNIWYHRTIQADATLLSENDYILHFEGSDFITKLWVNEQYAGSHRGGYARFSFDITNLLKDGDNSLTVKVEDSFDMQQPRGKQRWVNDSFECWYVQTTGIWKTVWSEYVPKIRMERVKMTPILAEHALDLEYELKAPEALFDGSLAVMAEISFEGRLVSRSCTTATASHVELRMNVFSTREAGIRESVHTWSPDAPNLYDIRFEVLANGSATDRAGSYFAMREIRIDGPHILLNGRPIYQRLILDQGYWKDSHLTPPCEEALIEDIDKIRSLGYNGLRKHQKTEDERFLYWCDVKGMLVWGEMPSAYRYTDYAVTEFTTEWLEIITQNYNHPCIITWTPFNESWGISRIKTRRAEQHFTEGIYHLTKSVDKYRPVIVNDGWEHTISDIITLHDYEEAGEVLYQRYMEYPGAPLSADTYPNKSESVLANGYEYRGQPIIISEYGGIAFDNGDSGWGYGNKVATKEAFLQRFDEITTAVKKLPYICGFCYTQVSDVQQEINGLMDMERNFKVEPEKIREVNEWEAGYWRSYH